MKDVIEREKLVRETLKAEYDAKEAEKQAVENEENTGDLISRDTLLKILQSQYNGIKANTELYTDAEEVANEVSNMIDIVKELPVAYDVNKVIKGLEEARSRKVAVIGAYCQSTLTKAIDVVNDGWRK